MTFVTFVSQVWDRTVDIIILPGKNLEAIWLLVPLLITMLAMEFYFGRHTKEELGWNTAYGNSLVLLFIAAFLFKYINENNLWLDATKMAVMTFLIFVGSVLTIVDFLHLIPKEFAFKMSSKLPINFLAYAVIVVIYSDIPINFITILAFLIVFVAFAILVWFIRIMAPKVRDTIMPGSIPSPTPEPPEYKEST